MDNNITEINNLETENNCFLDTMNNNDDNIKNIEIIKDKKNENIINVEYNYDALTFKYIDKKPKKKINYPEYSLFKKINANNIICDSKTDNINNNANINNNKFINKKITLYHSELSFAA